MPLVENKKTFSSFRFYAFNIMAINMTNMFSKYKLYTVTNYIMKYFFA